MMVNVVSIDESICLGLTSIIFFFFFFHSDPQMREDNQSSSFHTWAVRKIVGPIIKSPVYRISDGVQ